MLQLATQGRQRKWITLLDALPDSLVEISHTRRLHQFKRLDTLPRVDLETVAHLDDGSVQDGIPSFSVTHSRTCVAYSEPDPAMAQPSISDSASAPATLFHFIRHPRTQTRIIFREFRNDRRL